ncbi:MAG: hypothetical protein D6772_13725, partial [Bacteroidetes bacterium]
YSLFNYAVPQPDREFFHLFYRVTEADYFRQLGFSPDYYRPEQEYLDRRAIKRAVEEIATKYRGRYPQLRPSLSMLRFDSLLHFSKSYLRMVRELDLTRMD